MAPIKYPLLIALPHSSNQLPKKVRESMTLNSDEIERYLDIGSGELYDFTDFYSLPAKFSRLYFDLNRAPDHQVAPQNRKGVILETTYLKKIIYKKPLTEKEKSKRISEHNSYFKELKKEIQTKNIRFLISAHTMDHLSFYEKNKAERADICLSNNDFVTCDMKTIHELKKLLEEEGYSVSINHPFKGGYLLNYLCHRDNLPGLQMEFNFKLIGDQGRQALNLKKVGTHKAKLKRAFLKFIRK